MTERLFLLDAYALIFRAYYAFIRSPRIDSTGRDTGAVFGFALTLLDILEKESPEHIAVVFDPPGGSFRRYIQDYSHRKDIVDVWHALSYKAHEYANQGSIRKHEGHLYD